MSSPRAIDIIVPTLIVTGVAFAMLLLLRRRHITSSITLLGVAALMGIVSSVAVYVTMIFLPPVCDNAKSK